MGIYNVNRDKKYTRTEEKKLDRIEQKDAERIAYNDEHGTNYSYGMFVYLKSSGKLKA